jgi:hypothetical protein
MLLQFYQRSHVLVKISRVGVATLIQFISFWSFSISAIKKKTFLNYTFKGLKVGMHVLFGGMWYLDKHGKSIHSDCFYAH